jgi:hypothetical protein
MVENPLAEIAIGSQTREYIEARSLRPASTLFWGAQDFLVLAADLRSLSIHHPLHHLRIEALIGHTASG